jgi:predicted PurR-regulated permease PerM
MPTPNETLRAWLPHLLMLALLGLAVWLLCAVFAPLGEPVLLAASLAALSYSILFEPLNHVTRRRLPFLNEYWRRRVVATVALLVLVVVLISPIILMLLTSFGASESMVVLQGIATRDEMQVDKLADLARDKVILIKGYYPDLPVAPSDVRDFLERTLSRSSNQAMLGFFFHGSGGFLARLVLSLMLLFYFYEHGPRLVRMLLSYTPLDAKHRVELKRRFHHIVVRLMTEVLGAAVIKGLALGTLAGVIGGYNFFAVAIVTTFICLIPVVGFTFVWLPLASLLWTQEHHIAAIIFALASIATAWLVEVLNNHMTRRLDPRLQWMSVALFLSIISGLISFGAIGIVIGPTAIVVLAVLGSFWLPLYGVGSPDEVESLAPPPSDER